MKKIKILFSIGRLSVGGAEKLLMYKLKHLNTDRFEPYLLTLFPETQESLADLLPISPSLWHHANFRGTFDVTAFFRLWSWLRAEQFDVVVTELFSANFLVRFAALWMRSRPTLISYEHNLYPDKSRWQIYTDRFLSRFTARIIVDASSAKTFTAKQERISEAKFVVQYHPPLIFDGPALSRERLFQKFNIPADAKIVLTVSRLVPEKGHEYLMRAASEVIKKYPHAYFLIVGWGTLLEHLKTVNSELKTEKNIILAGRMDIKDVLPYADIYVEPALHVDIGIATLEAMKLGKPIVSTNVGDMSVFVQENKNGFLVPSHDASALAERIDAILSQPILQSRMGEYSAKIVAQYTIAAYTQAFESLVIDVAKRE